MNKVFKELSEDLGLQFLSKEDILTGEYRGFKVVVQDYKTQGFYILKVPFTSSSEMDIDAIVNFTNSIKSEIKEVNECNYENPCLTVKLARGIKGSKNSENLIEILNRITNFAFASGYTTCCDVCGKLHSAGIYQINNYPMLMCDECHNNFLEDVNNRQQNFKEKNSNIVTGIVGAFIGSLIGVALWVFVYNLGYIAAACGIVLAVCIIKGYELLGGKLNKTGMLITIGITIVMVYVATYLSYGVEIHQTLKDVENISILEAIKSVGIFLDNFPEVKSAFEKDLLMGYGFTALGAFSTFSKSYKERNFKVKTKNLGQ